MHSFAHCSECNRFCDTWPGKELLSCLYLWIHFILHLKCTAKLRQEDQQSKWQQYIFKVSGHPNYLPLMLFLVILVN